MLALEDISHDPAGVGLTRIRMFEDGTSEQEAMIQALKRSRALEVICLSYAIDRAEIVGGLSAIAQCQKVPVRLVVDRAQTSRTQEQKRVLLEAVKQGLDVRLRSGAQLREHYVAAGRGPHNFLGNLLGTPDPGMDRSRRPRVDCNESRSNDLSTEALAAKAQSWTCGHGSAVFRPVAILAQS